MSTTPERFLWAAGLMKIRSGDHILEIGCGAGLLAEEIVKQIKTGGLLAVDRSESMLLKAKQRNQEAVAKDRLKFLKGDFGKLSFSENAFDRVVAFNVNFFWKDPAKELLLIRKVLKKTGRLYVFYQYPFDITIEAAMPIRQKLAEHHFKVEDVQLMPLKPTAAIGIIARP